MISLLLEPKHQYRTTSVERTLKLKPTTKSKRAMVQLPREVHTVLRAAAQAHNCEIMSLASKLIMDGLDNMPAKQLARSG
jgi:hypothetical protein